MLNKSDILDIIINDLRSGIYSQEEIAQNIEEYKNGKENGKDKQSKKILQNKSKI